jgi:sulfite reductase (NADPH) hemoprotein beta-component
MRAIFGSPRTQNPMIARVRPRQKGAIERLLAQYGLDNDVSGLRLNSLACVALPTCGLRLAEGECYLPDLVTALQEVTDRAGLCDDDIVIRMRGCPNGCARPYLAEIGLVGRTPGEYNLYLGAAFDGSAESARRRALRGFLDPQRLCRQPLPGETSMPTSARGWLLSY